MYALCKAECCALLANLILYVTRIHQQADQVKSLPPNIDMHISAIAVASQSHLLGLSLRSQWLQQVPFLLP